MVEKHYCVGSLGSAGHCADKGLRQCEYCEWTERKEGDVIETYTAVGDKVFYNDRSGRAELFLTVHPTADTNGVTVERQAMMLAELLSQLPVTMRSTRPDGVG